MYTVSGAITDASTGFGSGLSIQAPVSVQATDDKHLGRTTTSNLGFYRLEGIAAGNLTLSASVNGYQTVTKTLAVNGNTQVDFALPRIAKSGTPNIAGVWGARVHWGGGVWIGEFTLTQSGSSFSGTWRTAKSTAAPSEWRGTITGNVTTDRSIPGEMTMNTPCTAAGALVWGIVDYSERYVTLQVPMTPSAGTCPAGVSDYNTFELDRTCRLTDTPTLSCALP
jgi:carboxypeptidase family protein